MKDLSIGSGVRKIGSSTFFGCSGLETITVNSENTFYSGSGNCITHKESGELILGCRSSVIPADGSVKSIGSRAFFGCAELTAVTIPDGVESIGDSAFYGCSGLTGIAIPDSVTSVGFDAFADCSGLKRVDTGSLEAWCGISFYSLYSNPLIYAHDLYLDGEPVAALVIPDTVERVGSFAFAWCSMTDVTIPDSVTEIGNDAFRGCSALAGVKMGSGLTKIGSSAFGGCGSLTGLDIPDGVLSIGSYAFAGCGLKKLDVPGSVTSIGSYAFSDCGALTSVTVGGGVIGSSAFYRCGELKTVELLYKVQKIGKNAFSKCVSLGDVYIYNKNCMYSKGLMI